MYSRTPLIRPQHIRLLFISDLLNYENFPSEIIYELGKCLETVCRASLAGAWISITADDMTMTRSLFTAYSARNSLLGACRDGQDWIVIVADYMTTMRSLFTAFLTCNSPLGACRNRQAWIAIASDDMTSLTQSLKTAFSERKSFLNECCGRWTWIVIVAGDTKTVDTISVKACSIGT